MTVYESRLGRIEKVMIDGQTRYNAFDNNGGWRGSYPLLWEAEQALRPAPVQPWQR